MSRASGANDTGEDIFIGARPTPILACGLYGPIRNTVDIAVMDVEVNMLMVLNMTRAR